MLESQHIGNLFFLPISVTRSFWKHVTKFFFFMSCPYWSLNYGGLHSKWLCSVAISVQVSTFVLKGPQLRAMTAPSSRCRRTALSEIDMQGLLPRSQVFGWRTLSRDPDEQFTRELHIHEADVHILLVFHGKPLFRLSWPPNGQPRKASHLRHFLGVGVPTMSTCNNSMNPRNNSAIWKRPLRVMTFQPNSSNGARWRLIETNGVLFAVLKRRVLQKRHRPPPEKTPGLNFDMAMYPHEYKHLHANSRWANKMNKKRKKNTILDVICFLNQESKSF
jgi:hypothetical protein